MTHALVLAADLDPTWQRALQVTPAVLWPLVVVLVVFLFRGQIKDKLGDIRLLKLSAVEAQFADRLGSVEPNGPPVPQEAEKGAIGRAVRSRKWCEGKRILWVDDNPGTNHKIAEIFKQLLGVRVDLVTSTVDGLQALRTNSDYTMVITDMARPDSDQAGLELIRQTRAEHIYRPTVVYSSLDNVSNDVPAGAFGLTNRPDQLLHYVIDVCERDD
jgi:CheY-like chemotaxis protein